MQCPRCQQDNPSPATCCLECGTPAPASGSRAASYNEQQRALAEALAQVQTRDRELVEAQEQQTATAEILRVISTSPTDVLRVFDVIVRTAVRLCGGLHSNASPGGGGLFHLLPPP